MMALCMTLLLLLDFWQGAFKYDMLCKVKRTRILRGLAVADAMLEILSAQTFLDLVKPSMHLERWSVSQDL